MTAKQRADSAFNSPISLKITDQSFAPEKLRRAHQVVAQRLERLDSNKSRSNHEALLWQWTRQDKAFNDALTRLACHMIAFPESLSGEAREQIGPQPCLDGLEALSISIGHAQGSLETLLDLSNEKGGNTLDRRSLAIQTSAQTALAMFLDEASAVSQNLQYQCMEVA